MIVLAIVATVASLIGSIVLQPSKIALAWLGTATLWIAWGVG